MGIKYLTTAYIDECGKFSEKVTNVAVHDVIQVVEGTLAENLDLLPYRLADVFMLLSRDRVLRKNDYLAKFPKTLAASLLVIHESNLYGVVIKDAEPQVVGMVRHLITSLNEQKKEQVCLIMDGKFGGGESTLNIVKSTDTIFYPQSQVLITVPLGAHCFVQYSAGHDGSGGEDMGEKEHESSLALLAGTAFLILDNIDLKWTKFKDCNMQETAVCLIDPGKCLFVYSGGLVLDEVGGYSFHGLGPRDASYNEAYYYALMHVGQSFSKEAPASD